MTANPELDFARALIFWLSRSALALLAVAYLSIYPIWTP